MTRLEIERLRAKAAAAYDALTHALDEDKHGEDCVLRCIEDPDCTRTHACDVCGDDE